MSNRKRTHKSHRSGRPKANPEMGELRLIGGRWKRSILTFPLLDGVRPTPSRVRETLFNWLSTEVAGSHCLDLFTGSGALGLEALSRGAASCTFVDQQAIVCDQLAKHAQRLGATNAQIIKGNAMSPEQLDFDESNAPEIIFIDPPFHQGLVPKLINALVTVPWFDKCRWVYIETEAQIEQINTPENWSLSREKQAGEVCYRLYAIR